MSFCQYRVKHRLVAACLVLVEVGGVIGGFEGEEGGVG